MRATIPYIMRATLAALLLLTNSPAVAQEAKVLIDGFHFEKLMDGHKQPTDINFLPDDRMLVTLREGKVLVYDTDFSEISTAIDLGEEGVCCSNGSERGLLSVAVHPKFEENGYLYLFYVRANIKEGTCELDLETTDDLNAPVNRVSRFTMIGNTIKLSSELVLLESGPVDKMHHGGAMAFGSDGNLYVTMGDGNIDRGGNPAGRTNNLYGKVLRVTEDGNVPEGNPFVGDPNSLECKTRRLADEGSDDLKCLEIYHIGFRNPFNIAMDPNNELEGVVRFFLNDVGAETWEEVNEMMAGPGYGAKYYGWPTREGPCEYGKESGDTCDVDPNYEDPLHFYGRPGPWGQTGAAITAGAFIPNGAWTEEYDGKFFYADMRAGFIYYMEHDPSRGCRGSSCDGTQTSEYEPIPVVQDANEDAAYPFGSPLRLRFGPRNSLYFLTYRADYGIYRFYHDAAKTNRAPLAKIRTFLSVNSNEDGDGLTVQFDGSGSTDPDGDDLTYEWAFGDGETAEGDALTNYTYWIPGVYIAHLTVSDGNGGSSAVSYEIFVDNESTPLEIFPWNHGEMCGDGYDRCGVLEFCQQGSTYGYKLPQSGDECVPGRGPVIRMDAGNKYRLTLSNVAEEGSTPTNIHTHGLHISGTGDADNVLREVHGMRCLDYTWDIPPDHPGGTCWYHPHGHGTSDLQVGGGAFGLLIVEDDPNDADIPGWASNELLLQVSVIQEVILGNGKQYEIFHVKAGQWYRLRVSVVDRLALPQELSFTDGCQVHHVASDGIWHSSVPGPEESVYSLTGASRADFAINCPSPQSTINILWADKVVAIVDIGDMELNPFTLTTWEPIRPPSLAGIATADVPSENHFNITVQRETLNDLVWSPSVALADISWNEVQEWEISDTTDHPFHLHLYHMLIVTPGGCGAHKEGEFYDTISGPACTVRFKTADIGQMCVLHCHVMPHSDSGAMGWVNVQGSDMPRYDTDSPEYECKASPDPTPAPDGNTPPTIENGGASSSAIIDTVAALMMVVLAGILVTFQ